MWQTRIDVIPRGEIANLAEPVPDLWIGPSFRQVPVVEQRREFSVCKRKSSCLAACEAIRDASLTRTIRSLIRPVLAISGAEDGACPPDTTAQTAALISGAQCEQDSGTGHLPCVVAPLAYAEVLAPFLQECTHG